MKIKALMIPDPISITEKTSIKEAIEIMKVNSIRHLPVTGEGKMLLGFALLAYPAQHGNSGVMTFIVNQEGAIYQKDLGKDTRRKAEAMTVFDPDKTWQKVKETLQEQDK